MEKNMDEGQMLSIQSTRGYEPKRKGDMKYLEHYVLRVFSYKDMLG